MLWCCMCDGGGASVMRILLALLLSFSAFAAGPAISAFTLTSASSSELLGTWTTDATSTSALTCGTTSGVYTITSETVNHLARGYSVTSHRMTIAGLQPVTTYFCKPISTSAGERQRAGRNSARRPRQRSLSGILGGRDLPAVRYNDQFGINGRRSDGDTIFADGLETAITTALGRTGRSSTRRRPTTLTSGNGRLPAILTLTNGVNVSAWTNAGTVRDAQIHVTYNDGGGHWATNGVYAVWDQASQTSILYNSIYRRILNATEADASHCEVSRLRVHWIAAQNNTGPGVVGTLAGRHAKQQRKCRCGRDR
jgi:hypothetical protein